MKASGKIGSNGVWVSDNVENVLKPIYIYIYVCVCVCVYTYIYIYTHIYYKLCQNL